MSVLCIDFGNSFIKLSKSENGIINVLTDNGSYLINNCLTFKDYRLHGVNAINNNNFFSTIGDLKRMIGLEYNDIKKIPYINNNIDQENNFNIKINKHNFDVSIIHLVGMIIDYHCNKNKIKKISISVPDNFNQAQRQILVNCCKIFNIDIFSLVNESEAISLDYGFYKIYRQEFNNDEKVLFINLNQSNLHIFLSVYNQNSINILNSVNNNDLGGCKINEILISFMISEINEYFSVDISNNKKSLLKIIKECEKMKKILSANNEYTFYIESLHNEEDYSKNITKSMFESMLSIYFDQFNQQIVDFITQQFDNGINIDKIELLGGNSRIPKIKNIISSLSISKIESTLNFDQTVCKGMVLYNSILNKSNTLKDFNLVIKSQEKIEIEINNNQKKILIFDSDIILPKTSKITLNYQRDYNINIYNNGQLIKNLTFFVSEYKEYEKIIIFFNFSKDKLLKINKVKIIRNCNNTELDQINKDSILTPKSEASDYIDLIDEQADLINNSKSTENEPNSFDNSELEQKQKSDNPLNYDDSSKIQKDKLHDDDNNNDQIEYSNNSNLDKSINKTKTIQIFPNIIDSLEITKDQLDKFKDLEEKLRINDEMIINFNEIMNKLESLHFNSQHLYDKIIDEPGIILRDKVISIIDQDLNIDSLEKLKQIYYQFKDLINKVKC